VWFWIGASAAVLVLIVVVAGELTIGRAGPILKSRIAGSLRGLFTGFRSRQPHCQQPAPGLSGLTENEVQAKGLLYKGS